MWPGDDDTPSELGLDHQPRIHLCIGDNLDPLLIAIREFDKGIPRDRQAVLLLG
jgi:hypothetical protein